MSVSQPHLQNVASPNRVGVIDIGSNSVRLVIFETSGRCIRSFFNEKVQAGLGRGLRETGRLDPEGREATLSAICRFRAVLQGQEVTDIKCFATAAVRDAEDGPEFTALIRSEYGFNISVLTGADEARLASTGVVAMQPKAEGVSGDLGGSSLELSRIVAGQYTGGSTYPLGPLALGDPDAFQNGNSELSSSKLKQLNARIASALKNAPELSGSQDAFYAVGGAWRAIVRIHMEASGYPLRMLQHYETSADSMLDLTEGLMVSDRQYKDHVDAIAGRRSATMPYAAAVLNNVLRAGGFKRVVASSYGVREGVVFDGMSPGLQRSDPLPAAMRVLVSQHGHPPAFSVALPKWLGKAGERTLSPRLLEAACLAADSGALFHPDHRADMAFEWLVTAPVTGVTHIERASIALAVACRYSRSFKHTVSEKLLDGELRGKARALGALMRLAADFSGRTKHLLERAALSVENDTLRLEIASGEEDLVSDMVEKRLQQAAGLLQLTPELVLLRDQA